MDEKNFKRHLRDMVRGKHNTAEHDWAPGRRAPKAKKRTTKPARRRSD
jgi:hypothetical protein